MLLVSKLLSGVGVGGWNKGKSSILFCYFIGKNFIYHEIHLPLQFNFLKIQLSAWCPSARFHFQKSLT